MFFVSRKKYIRAKQNESDIMAEHDYELILSAQRAERVKFLEGQIAFAKKMFSVHGVNPAIVDNFKPESV